MNNLYKNINARIRRLAIYSTEKGKCGAKSSSALGLESHESVD
jgi:hypothetical protein